MNWSPSLSTGPRATPVITNRSTLTAGSPWAVSPAVRTPSHGATAYKSHTRAPWGSQTTRRHPAAFHHLPREEGREKEGGKEEGRGAEKTEPGAGVYRFRRSYALHGNAATTSTLAGGDVTVTIGYTYEPARPAWPHRHRRPASPTCHHEPTVSSLLPPAFP